MISFNMSSVFQKKKTGIISLSSNLRNSHILTQRVELNQNSVLSS